MDMRAYLETSFKPKVELRERARENFLENALKNAPKDSFTPDRHYREAIDEIRVLSSENGVSVPIISNVLQAATKNGNKPLPENKANEIEFFLLDEFRKAANSITHISSARNYKAPVTSGSHNR